MISDVVIIGGGVIGSSAAYHLLTEGFRGRVAVVERDPSYARASSNLAMGGIRQQFATLPSVAMARYSIEFYKQFDAAICGGSLTPPADFRQRGYLFLANDQNAAHLNRRFDAMRAAGARVDRLSSADVRDLLPDLVHADLKFGLLGKDDGYANPRAVLAGFRQAASHAGASYLDDEVVAIERSEHRVEGVRLGKGDRIATTIVVNAAGPYARAVGRLANTEVPVDPVRQQLFRAALPTRWPYRFPMVVDPTGVHWRHEDADRGSPDDTILVAKTNLAEAAGENFHCDLQRWTDEFFPPLKRRVPAFGGLRLLNGWSGLYEMTSDHNPVIGEHPELEGFILANGFSGHGLMLSPATGKIVSELVRLKRSETFEITSFDVRRFARGKLLSDEATI